MGYVFGQPLLVKTNNGRWSVVVSGGYNVGNANGHAFLFVIDAETGTLVAKIDTGAGTAASPNGLSAAARDRHQRRRRRRLSPTPATSTATSGSSTCSARCRAAGRSATAALPLFAAGAGHAITGRPDVTKFTAGGYLVAFGTGRYIADAATTPT